MSDHDTLKTKVIEIDPADAMHRAMHEKDPEAGLIMAVMYQALLKTLDDMLDEFEHEPEQLATELGELLNMLDPKEDQPTLN